MAEPVMQRFTLLYLIRLPFKLLNFTYGGSFHGTFCQRGTPDFVASYAPVAMEVLRRHQEKGLIMNCGDDSMMGCVAGMGGGNYTLLEQFVFWDPHDKESVKGAVACFDDAAATAHEHGLPLGSETRVRVTAMSKQERQSLFLQARQPARFHWQRKIKQMLDPNDTGDESYATLGEERK